MISKEEKKAIFQKFGKDEQDTGSPEGQISLFSHRINSLTEHRKTHKKDYATQYSLLKLVGKRRRLLSYLKDKDIDRYRTVLKELNLRR